MVIRLKLIVASAAAAFLLMLGSASAANAQRGMIISRSGDSFVMTGADGTKTSVAITDDTDVRDRKGLFGLRKDHLGDTVLIPGLKVEVKGDTDAQGRVVAKIIEVDGDDLETAEMIQAGLHPTAEQVQANLNTLQAHQKEIATTQQGVATNQQSIAATQGALVVTAAQVDQNVQDISAQQQRFNSLTDYDQKGQATVLFATGSATITKEYQQQLVTLAQTATGLTGYLIEVTGYTDSTGSAAMNTTLSENRAKAVINFLVQQGNIPIRHIVAPGAMGEYGAVSTNETKAGRADNRRVDVKVLVNKGLQGGQ